MLVAFANPFTFLFLCFAFALGANRQPLWTGLLAVPFSYWSSGISGAVDAVIVFAVARALAEAWLRRRGAS